MTAIIYFSFIFNILYLGNFLSFYMRLYYVCLNKINLSPNHFRVFICIIYDFLYIVCIFRA